MAQPVVPTVDPNVMTDEQALQQFQQNIVQPPGPEQLVESPPAPPQQMIMPEPVPVVPASLNPEAVPAPEQQQFVDQLTQVPQPDPNFVPPEPDDIDQLISRYQMENKTEEKVIDKAALVQQAEGLRNEIDIMVREQVKLGIPAEKIKQNMQKRVDAMNALRQQAESMVSPEEAAIENEIEAEQAQAMQMAQTAEQAGLQAEQLALNAEARKQAKQVVKQQAVANEAIQQDKLNEVVANKVQQDDEYVARSLPEIMQKGTFGQKLGAALAVIAGGISQGMLKLNSNPALDVINKEVERYAAQQKLKAEEREALRKQLIEAGKQSIAEKLKGSQVLLNNTKIAQAMQEMELKAQEAGQKQYELSMMSQVSNGAPITREVANRLPKEYQERIVKVPKSDLYTTVFAGNKDKFNEFMSEAEPAYDDLGQVIQMAESGSFNKFNLGQRREMASRIETLIGKLRLPILGPGVMTQPEYDRLKGAIGDPNKIASFGEWELRALRTIQNTLDTTMKTRLKQAGGQVVLTPKEKMVEEFKRKRPNMSLFQIQQAVDRKMGYQ